MGCFRLVVFGTKRQIFTTLAIYADRRRRRLCPPAAALVKRLRREAEWAMTMSAKFSLRQRESDRSCRDRRPKARWAAKKSTESMNLACPFAPQGADRFLKLPFLSRSPREGLDVAAVG